MAHFSQKCIVLVKRAFAHAFTQCGFNANTERAVQQEGNPDKGSVMLGPQMWLAYHAGLKIEPKP
jgi:hypothetical protein